MFRYIVNNWKMYSLYLQFCLQQNTEKQLIGKKRLYADVFNKKFNLSFKPPGLDTCDSYIAKLKGCLLYTSRCV